MALAFASLDAGITVGASASTATISTTAGRLYILSLTCSRFLGTGALSVSNGGGVTWTSAVSAVGGLAENSASIDNGAYGTTQYLTVLYGIAASSGSASYTITSNMDFPIGWTITEVTGADTSTPILELSVGSVAGGTTGSASIAAFNSSNNAVFATFITAGNETTFLPDQDTFGRGLGTALGTAHSSFTSLLSEWRAASGGTVQIAATRNTGAAMRGAALEIMAGTAPAGGPKDFAANISEAATFASALSRTRKVALSSTEAATVSAALGRIRMSALTISSAEGVSAAIKRARTAVFAVTESVGMTTMLNRLKLFALSVAESTSQAYSLVIARGQKQFSAAINAVETVSTAIIRRRGVAATSSEASSVSASIKRNRLATAVIASSTAVTSAVQRLRKLVEAISGTFTHTAALTTIHVYGDPTTVTAEWDEYRTFPNGEVRLMHLTKSVTISTRAELVKQNGHWTQVK